MFISDQFVFLELHKTGCTHIRTILNRLVVGETVGKHNLAKPELFNGKRKFIGSIRDPWEWYLSLWAFGCEKKGGVSQKVRRSKNVEEWNETYKNVNDPSAFQHWLYMLTDSQYYPDLGEGYSDRSLSKFVGFLTYRYLMLFCTTRNSIKNLDLLFSKDHVHEFEKTNCFIDYFIRNESLETDLFRIIETHNPELTTQTKLEILSLPRSNATSVKAVVDKYYDVKTEKLVASIDSLIVRKFGYTAPSEKNI